MNGYRRGPLAFTADQAVAKLTDRPPKAIRAALADLAHKAPAPNAAYVQPLDQTTVDQWFLPFVATSEGYLLLDRSWSAGAFYEGTLSALRRSRKFGDVDAKIGTSVERFVSGILREKGVLVRGGKYRIGAVEGECDFVVETESAIILIEMKKKALVRKTRSGDVVSLLVDLSQSVLDAMVQATEHAVRLYQHGSLTLRSDLGTYQLQRRNRQVERIALTVLDFGCLQDRTVLWQIFDGLLRVQVRSDDATAQRQLDKVQASVSALNKQQMLLNDLEPSMIQQPFFNCWFLSLGHLMAILDAVTSNDSFWSELKESRHFTTGSLDFYFEHATSRKIGRSK